MTATARRTALHPGIRIITDIPAITADRVALPGPHFHPARVEVVSARTADRSAPDYLKSCNASAFNLAPTGKPLSNRRAFIITASMSSLTGMNRPAIFLPPNR